MSRLVLLVPLAALFACSAPKDGADTSEGADSASDSGVDTDSGIDTDSGVDTDSGAACTPVAEACNGVDDDCDGAVDEEDATDAVDYYADADGDGYGSPGAARAACAQPDGYVTDNRDCDDSSALAYPGGAEVAGDGLDNDCDPNSRVTEYFYDAFQTDSPVTGQWALGYAPDGDRDQFAPMPNYASTDYVGVDRWRYPADEALTIYRNYSTNLVRYGSASFPAQTLILHPGRENRAAVLRWTAPASTECSVEVVFSGCDSTSTNVLVYAGEILLEDDYVDGIAETVSVTTIVPVGANENVDFVVLPNGTQYYDSTCVVGSLACL